MTDTKNVIFINEDLITRANQKSRLGDFEHIHQDFPLFVSCYLENTTKKPILLKGPFESGKTTMTMQLGKIIGQEPKIFDFSHSKINNIPYMDQNEMIHELRDSENKGEFIVIKDFDQLDTYDTYLLMTYFLSIENNKNPKSTIVIIDNSTKKYFRDLTDVVRRSSGSVTIGTDPYIAAKIQKEKEEKEKAAKEAKQKMMKGVK